MKQTLQKAFTIVELLVIVVILGIISALVLLAINPAKKINLSKDARVKSDIAQIVNSLQTYYANPLSDAKYPSAPDGLDTLIQSGELKSLPNQQEGFTPCPATPGGITTGTTYCYTVSEESEDKVIAVWGTLFSKGLLAWCWDSTTGTFTEKKEGETLPTEENPSCKIAIPTDTPIPTNTPPAPTITPTPPNTPPWIFSMNSLPNPVIVGNVVTFTANWEDSNVGDRTKIHICKTSAFSNQICTGGSWCDTTSFSSTSPSSCQYQALSQDVYYNKSFYAYICDDDNLCSTTAYMGNFQVLPASCNGNPIALNIYKWDSQAYAYCQIQDSVFPNEQATAIVSGLTNCAGKTVSIKRGSCTGTQICSCAPTSSGYNSYCQCNVPAPSTAGSHVYYACVDFNNNGIFESGEYTSDTLVVCNPPPTINSISYSPSSARVGQTVTFTVNWSDPGDMARISICNGWSGSGPTCYEFGYLCQTTSYSSSSPISCQHVVSNMDEANADWNGTAHFLAYVCDDENTCTSRTGTYMIDHNYP